MVNCWYSMSMNLFGIFVANFIKQSKSVELEGTKVVKNFNLKWYQRAARKVAKNLLTLDDKFTNTFVPSKLHSIGY